MKRRVFLVLLGTAALSACATPELAADGSAGGKVYWISDAAAGGIQLRLLDSVNLLRKARGAGPLELNANLTAAGATHARDMSVQNRPWHFGSDGSSPVDRAARAGYGGTMLGELIAETYETELQTLAAWMDDKDTREVILNPAARDLGFAFYQERNGKIWWVLTTGTRGEATPLG